MNHNYNRNYSYRNNDFDISLNTGYVDVFGRVVRVFEDDDSGEIFVSLTELKKSGFELFEKRTYLRNSNTTVLNRLQMEQFDTYIRMKAAKFLNRINLELSSNEVDRLIEKHKPGFHPDINRKIEIGSTPRQIQITTRVEEPDRSDTSYNSNNQRGNQSPRMRSRSRSAERNRSNNFSNSGEMRRPHNSSSQSRRSFENDYQTNSHNDKSFDNHQRYNRSSSQGRRSFESNNQSGGQNQISFDDQQGFNNQYKLNGTQFRNKTFNNHETNSPKSFDSNESPNRSYNKNFGLKKENTLSSVKINGGGLNSPKSDRVRFNVPEDSGKMVHSLKESKSVSFEEKAKNSSIGATSTPVKLEETNEKVMTTKETILNKASEVKSEQSNESVLTTRGAVIDKASGSGLFEGVEVVDENTIIGFVFPNSYQQELADLDGIAQDSKDDPHFFPAIGDTIAVYLLKDDTYVRGTVTNIVNNVYSCALIDFGLMETTSRIRKLPEKYINIPEFACICTGESRHLQDIILNGMSKVEVKMPKVLTIKLEEPDREYELKAEKWDPMKFTPCPEKISKLNDVPVYNTVANKNILKPDDRVMIVSEMGGCLILRTRECMTVLKQVNEQLKNYEGQALTGVPAIDQLCIYSDEKFVYRIQVAEICGTDAMVRSVDYGTFHRAPLSDLRTINKDLAECSNTLIKISLFGFIDTAFTSKALELINEYKVKKEKFTVVPKDGMSNVFDLLFSDGSSVSEKLKQVDIIPAPKPVKLIPQAITPTEKPKNVIPVEKTFFLKDLPKCQLAIGKQKMLCTYVECIVDGIATFCPTTDEATLSLNELTEKVLKLIEADKQAYSPKLFELCVAEFEGEWYRAAVVEVFEKEFALLYVDYGNSSTVEADKIRKISQEVAQIPCISALCNLQDVLKNGESVVEPLLSEMKKSLLENEVYEIDVIKEVDQEYNITIPDLYKVWKEKKLL